jgi:hypothetical protein
LRIKSFETYKSSILVPKFNDLVVTSMLRGQSNASFDDPGFDIPGETVVIPSNVEMKIDFRKRLKVIPLNALVSDRTN